MIPIMLARQFYWHLLPRCSNSDVQIYKLEDLFVILQTHEIGSDQIHYFPIGSVCVDVVYFIGM